jgi:hypothetical protein
MRVERLALEPIVERCRNSDDGSDCFREGSAYRVRLWGGLPDGWAGNFALHACALGLEIVSGEAICVDSARWAASFVLRTADPRARMARHDFLHMARRAPRVVPPLPEPDVEIALQEAPHRPDSVIARVTGKDTIGLLAEVLRRFDAWGLRLHEFSIRTIHDDVDDWFWLERRTPPAERSSA